MRMIDRICELTVSSIINMDIIIVVIPIMGLWVFDWGGPSLFYGHIVAEYLGMSVMILYLFFLTDWETIPRVKPIDDLAETPQLMFELGCSHRKSSSNSGMLFEKLDPNETKIAKVDHDSYELKL